MSARKMERSRRSGNSLLRIWRRMSSPAKSVGGSLHLTWSDIDWQNLSLYLRRAMVSGRLDDVKTGYSEVPLPLDPALAKLILEWQRKSEFRSDSDFMFPSPFMASNKPYSPRNMQHNHLRPPLSERGGGRSVGILRTTLTAWGTTASRSRCRRN